MNLKCAINPNWVIKKNPQEEDFFKIKLKKKKKTFKKEVTLTGE